MLSPLLRRLRTGRRSLRFLIVSSVMVGLGACFLISDTVIYTMTSRQLRDRISNGFVRSNYLFTFTLDGWLAMAVKQLKETADRQDFRALNKAAMQVAIQDINDLYPERQIGVWTPAGRLIVGSKERTLGVEDKRIVSSSVFRNALRGITNPNVLGPRGQDKGCILIARAIVPAAAKGSDGSGHSAPAAVLTYCMQNYKVSSESSFSHTAFNIISLQNQRYRGAEVMAVTAAGKVFFPLSNVNDPISSQSAATIAAGPWGPFVKFALSNGPEDSVQLITTQGHQFLATKHWLTGKQIAVVTILNYEAALQKIVNASNAMYLAVLLLMGAVVYYISGGIVRPIEKASRAIREISKGNFSVHIDDERRDEIGDLYQDINVTGGLLSALVASEKSHAAADQQLATARQIQKSFLLQELPEASEFEVAASSLPAYQVGADWYDSLHLGRFLYVVVADVCDKGIPSALFMSVFRTLLRTHILAMHDLVATDQPVDIAQVATVVNDYMTSNHGDTCMFATIFMASYDLQTGRLRYVNAGHECPLILRQQGAGTAELEALQPTGPAVGVFPGSTFGTGEASLAVGDLLLSYTDGLTDARSPEQGGWGLERLKHFLASLPEDQWHPDHVLETLFETIKNFEAGADRFDDLTVLSLRRRL